jgi:hypothetical protein
MALLLILLLTVFLLTLFARRQKRQITPKEAEQIDELITVIIPTINSKK